jgi:hypothetical protein
MKDNLHGWGMTSYFDFYSNCEITFEARFVSAVDISINVTDERKDYYKVDI